MHLVYFISCFHFHFRNYINQLSSSPLSLSPPLPSPPLPSPPLPSPPLPSPPLPSPPLPSPPLPSPPLPSPPLPLPSYPPFFLLPLSFFLTSPPLISLPLLTPQPTQVELVLLILRRLAEDVHLSYDSGLTPQRRKQMAATLSENSESLFTFLLNTFEVGTCCSYGTPNIHDSF